MGSAAMVEQELLEAMEALEVQQESAAPAEREDIQELARLDLEDSAPATTGAAQPLPRQ